MSAIVQQPPPPPPATSTSISLHDSKSSDDHRPASGDVDFSGDERPIDPVDDECCDVDGIDDHHSDHSPKPNADQPMDLTNQLKNESISPSIPSSPSVNDQNVDISTGSPRLVTEENTTVPISLSAKKRKNDRPIKFDNGSVVANIMEPLTKMSKNVDNLTATNNDARQFIRAASDSLKEHLQNVTARFVEDIMNKVEAYMCTQTGTPGTKVGCRVI